MRYGQYENSPIKYGIIAYHRNTDDNYPSLFDRYRILVYSRWGKSDARMAVGNYNQLLHVHWSECVRPDLRLLRNQI